MQVSSPMKALDMITRPPRGTYNNKNLGDIYISDDQPPITRIPVSFKNNRDLVLVGSLYAPPGFPDILPKSCVIYLHGNVGTQVEGRFMVKHLAPIGVATFCFDFSGSGESEGDLVTLGINEKDDVVAVVEFLHKSFNIDKVILWGRSMGAAVSLLAAPYLKYCLGIITDSTYASLRMLFEDIAKKVEVPGIFKPFAIWYVKHHVNGKIGCDIEQVCPIESVKKLTIPIVIGHAALDSFIPFTHSQAIYEHYGGNDKILFPLPDDHNSRRPPEWLQHCFNFICKVSEIEEHRFRIVGQTLGHDQHFASFQEMVNKPK